MLRHYFFKIQPNRSLALLALMLCGLPSAAVYGQASPAPILEDAESAEIRSHFAAFKSVQNIQISGTAQAANLAGAFLISRANGSYTLTLPEGGPEDTENFVDLHGGGSCVIEKKRKQISKTQNSLCGFPIPWFYPIGMLAALDRRLLKIETSADADHIVLLITPSPKNLTVRPSQIAKLFISPTKGTLDSYVYSYPDAKNASHMLHVVVTYANYQMFHGLLLPQSISRSVEGGSPLVLSIDSVTVVSQ